MSDEIVNVTDTASTIVTNALPTNMRNTVSTNVMSPVSINSVDKKVDIKWIIKFCTPPY